MDKDNAGLKSIRLGGVWFTGRLTHEQAKEIVRRHDSFPALVRVLKEAADLLYASMDEKQPGGSYGHDCHLAYRKAEELLNTL